MRSFVLLTFLLTLPGTASAGTFLTIDPAHTGSSTSIMSFGDDAPPAPKKKIEAPSVAPGHELVQVKQVDGKTKIFRTAAWFGGSPVTYVTVADDDELAALKRQGIDVASSKPQTVKAPRMLAASMPADADASGVDTRETTGALPDVITAAPARPLDAKGLELRSGLGDS